LTDFYLKCNINSLKTVHKMHCNFKTM